MHIKLGKIIKLANVKRAGKNDLPILSMTMRDGLVDQAEKFKKRIASADTSQYKIVARNQLVVGFPIDEGVLAFQRLYDSAIVSPAYNIWDLQGGVPINLQYLERFLRSPHAVAFYKSKLRNTTARRRSLPNDIFLSLPVPTPPLPQQDRIVRILNEADNLRELRAEADQRTSAYIPSLFHEMFGDLATNPKGWPAKSLGEVLEISRERIEPTEHPQTSFNYIGLEQIERHTGNLVQYESTPGAEIKSTKNVFHRDEVLYGKLRPYLNKVHLADKEGICSTDIFVLRPHRCQLHSYYVASFLRSSFVLSFVSNAMAGANLPRIGQGALLGIRTPIPPLTLQEKFAARVSEIRELEAAQSSSRQRLDDLFQSILYRAFNGEL